MRTVAIVTDSSASLPAELIERYAITVVPIWLIDGDHQLRDGHDVEAEELYRRLRADPALRISSATPSVGEFLSAYDRLLAERRQLVSVHISGTLTSIVEVARQAAAQRPEATIEVIDSGTASMACGFAVLAAARAAAAGVSAPESAAVAVEIAGRARLVGLLETLSYVEHSGRLKAAGAQAADRLHLRPLIAIEGGRVRFLRMERTRRRARQRLLELIEREARGHPLHAAVIHAGVPEEAADLAAALAERLDCVELLTSAFTPVLGGHTGPGFLGIAFYPEDEWKEGENPPVRSGRTLERQIAFYGGPRFSSTHALAVVVVALSGRLWRRKAGSARDQPARPAELTERSIHPCHTTSPGRVDRGDFGGAPRHPDPSLAREV